MEWLLRRSVGLGLPAPALLDPAGTGDWSGDDLHSFTDAVDVAAEPLGRTVKVTGLGATQPVERHVAVMSVGRVEEIEAPDPGHEPWLSHTDRLPFPVEWSAQFDVLSGGEARQAIQRKLLVVRDMQRHYHEHDLDEPLALDRQAQHARQVEDQMSRGVEVAAARVHGWFRVAVSARSEEECLERVRKIKSSYRGRRVSIEHPRGQYGLMREFIPGEPVSTTAYRRRLPVLYLTAGVPMASSQLGDRRGPYVGYTAGSSRRAVMFDTHFATEERETSGLVPVVGGLGAGKSVLLGQVTYEAVRRGIPSVVLDPSGPLARLTELPELRGHSEHLDLTTAASGTLNPFDVVARPRRAAFGSDDAFAEAEVLAAQDRKLLAMDVVKMLLPPSLDSIPETSLVISDAVRATRGEAEASLWTVVENLEQLDAAHGRVVANYLRDMAELPLARLFFPRASAGAERLDATLTVLTMPGLVLPPRSVPRDHWSTSEQLAVPLLHLASWYATRAVYGRTMQSRKLVALDETHFLGEWSAGRALFTRLGRDSRKWNTCVLAASQNPADVLGMDVANFMSAAFVGRIEDEEAARDGLRMLRVPTGIGYERALASLSSGRGTTGFREFVMRDVDGNVDKIRVDLTANPDLLEALNTTARDRRHPRRGGAGRMTRRLPLALLVGLVFSLLVMAPQASATEVRALGLDCKESPTPDMPGQGLAAFFDRPPKELPPPGDPFIEDSPTTIYEQYGFSGLRWNTYDLGCGPDVSRSPDAVIGTAVSNWIVNLPIALAGLTASITRVAFNPTFLDVFDPALTRVSDALHQNLFASWVPALIAVLGVLILFRARRSSLATTAAAVGWALMVVLVATAVFRWPVAAGHFADQTVTSTLGSVVNGLGGDEARVDPGVAVASNVQESLFYESWLAGTLGSTDSATARKYGAELFKAQALNWHEARIVQEDPERGAQIIEDKRERWGELADEIRDSDPTAYEHLTGKRSDTRIGYAMLSAVGALLALPFLLVSALLLLGSFLIVRLAVMLFPAFATLGVLPAGRGLVLGLARTVGAALVNAVVFGIGAAITIRVLGLILDPASRLPMWLSFVLLPLFGFVMWVALKPFRRLTHMVSPHADPFGDAAGSVGDASRRTGRFARKTLSRAAAAYTGGVAAAATTEALRDDSETPDRAEARPSSVGMPTPPRAAAPPALSSGAADRDYAAAPGHPSQPGPSAPASTMDDDQSSTDYVPPPPSEGVPLPPTEPEWVDGEEVYALYRPASESSHDAA